MSSPAIVLSKQLVKYLKKYGPYLISLPEVFASIRDIINRLGGDKQAQLLLQQQLTATIQALEIAVAQRRIYHALTWVFGGIALISFSFAMWALGRIS